MEEKKIDDEFYANEEDEFTVEQPAVDSSLQAEEPTESSHEETQETKVEEQEDPNILSNNAFDEKEESQVEEEGFIPESDLSKTQELEMMFSDPKAKKPHKKHKNKPVQEKAPETELIVEKEKEPEKAPETTPIIEEKEPETTPDTTPVVEEEKVQEEQPVQAEVKPIENKPIFHEEIKVEPKPEIPNNNTPKYESFSHRMIRYGLFTALSIIFLTIAIVGFNKFKKDTSTYIEDATVNYQVCLKENDYYKDQCIGEEKEYISSATETIRLDYSYSAVYQKIANKDYKYYIKSTLLIKTDDDNEKELLKKEKNLTKKQAIELNGNVMTIAETIDIPFQEYNSYAQRYKNDYSLVSNCYLEISLMLKDGKNETKLSSVTMPLTKITYNITKNEKVNEISEYKVPTNLALRILFTVLIMLGAGLIVYSLYDLGKFLLKMRRSESAYEKKLKQILNTYDRVIITLEDKNTINPDQDVYTVKTFLELLDVRDTIDKPILYHKVNNIKSEFYVQDINKTYKFTMKESDFEEKQ